METAQIKSSLTDLRERTAALRGYLDFEGKQERLELVNQELEDPEVWADPARAEGLNKERSVLEKIVLFLGQADSLIDDGFELLQLAEEEDDQATLNSVLTDLDALKTEIEKLEFQRMFSGPADSASAFLDIQAGSGGTEAQDWAEMLLRMYLRWAEQNGFEAELIEASAGDVAGIKSATVHIKGEYAFGWLRTEIGVHRLVRKSPFDSGNRRHTSFSAVFVAPEVDDDIEIEINPADLRVDVYRASGAGGQHVNKTESAVRITHLPTNIVVQCQNDRSQHKNRDTAMKQLKAKLYEHEQQMRNAEMKTVEDSKSDIGWGSQIRSYVLDQSRIKDLRTGVETGNTDAVLNGSLNQFIEASLKQGL
ncbi:MAG: peptide chain release factor 2 [Chromatiales bacterium]|nr:peptide chain release factor 2 [Chromatiales bacterium]